MDPSAALKATAGAVTQKKNIYIYMSGWSLWMNRIEN
jgi:hypothetical protein